MELLEKEDIVEETPEVDNSWGEVEDFIQKLQIIDGDERVPFYVVYYAYKKAYPNKRKYMKYNEFFSKFSLYYEKKRYTNGYEFFLEKGAFDLSKENLWNASRDRYKQREKAKKEAKSKK